MRLFCVIIPYGDYYTITAAISYGERGNMKNIIIDILIVAAVVILMTATIKPTIVRGESMDDTLHDGNYLIIDKIAYKIGEPEYGDIVVIDSDYDGGKLLIKRVIGTGGDKITTDGKELFINDEEINEPYVCGGTVGDGYMETWEVPEGKLFVMGDNRDNSADSRLGEIGLIDEGDVVGKAAIRLYPFDSIGTLE